MRGALPLLLASFAFFGVVAGPAQSIVLDSFDAGATTGSVRAGSNWVGNVTQNATSLTVGGTATDVNGWGANGLSLDASSMAFITIAGQRDSGHAAPRFSFQLEDRNLNTQVFSVSATAFSAGALTLVQIAIPRWNSGFDAAQITGWSIGGGGLGLDAFRMTFDQLAFTATASPGVPIAPAITGSFGASTRSSGETITFTVNATGTAPLTYQWFKNGTIAVANTTTATTAVLTLDGLAALDSGTYTCTITNAAGSVGSDAFALTVSGGSSTAVRTDRLINLSSRARISPADGRLLIAGFVIGGTAPKCIVVRAIGPTLSAFGVAGTISNPRLQIFDGTGRMFLENDDWAGADTAAAFSQVGAFALANGSRDAAIVATLAPGAYTMHVLGGSETGVVLAEIYDVGGNPLDESQRLVNISARSRVDTGEGALIGGFVISGNSPKRVLIRGVGPTLAIFGVTGVLDDPRLTVYQGQTVIAQNDDWGTPVGVGNGQAATADDIVAAAKATGAFTYPTGTKDAAVVVTLAPGSYTAQVSGSDGQTGEALVEVYEIPP